MSKIDIKLCGVGGQGILSISTVLGEAATVAGLQLKQAEVHGMSQRGGDVQSDLRLSMDPIWSDLIPLGGADLIISMEPMEALRYLPYLAPDGAIVTSGKPLVNIPNYPDEAGLLAFCLGHGWEIAFYSADELCRAEGPFSASAFVQTQVGVDNVCERAAVLRSGGALVEKKYKDSGVTFALAEAPVELDWRY